MPDFKYAEGRIAESLQFITEEMVEFDKEYACKSWKEYQDDRKLQKIIDRTIENILTAFIEISGTILTEKGIAVESYSDTLKKIGEFFGLSQEEQENLSRLAFQRNRLAHRYLNFRWQAISDYAKQKGMIKKVLGLILEREKTTRD